MYLELAEGTEELNPFIFVPNFEQGGGIFVREDKFDAMPNDQFTLFMELLAPYQPEVEAGLSEAVYLADRASRREHRERRKEAKTQKKEGKGSAKKERQERKKLKAESKAESRTKRAEAKLTKSQTGGGLDLTKLTDTASTLIGKFTGKGGEAEAAAIPSGSDETPFYKKPAVLIGAAVLIGGGIYLATRKK